MKRLCGILATAALAAGVFAQAGRAEPSGPLSALEAICLHQEGAYHPGAPPGFALCTDINGVIIDRQVPGSEESSQLIAIDRLCKAAGFGGVRSFERGLPDGRSALVAWGCFAAP